MLDAADEVNSGSDVLMLLDELPSCEQPATQVRNQRAEQRACSSKHAGVAAWCCCLVALHAAALPCAQLLLVACLIACTGAAEQSGGAVGL